tara:strand:+ start:476 stop:613 length:138 start_codon:yes stop_codon:yes gene_type:complete
MIIKKIIILLFITIISLSIYVVFFWDIPAPTKKIEKNLEIHRFEK